MKTAINIFIFLAVTTFTFDVLSTFAVKNSTEELSKVAGADDETDSKDTSEDNCDPDAEKEKEDGESPIKQLFIEHPDAIAFEGIVFGSKAHFNEYNNRSGSHISAPPYSPPENV